MSDLEYVDDMALISDSYESLCTLLKSIDSTCHHTGLTINYKKTKLSAVLPEDVAHPPSSSVFFILTVIPLRWYRAP